MLDTIDDIPWSTLQHAYGKAVDVPQQIRDLANSNEDLRETALSGLSSSIFHQGYRYSASVAAVPFLFELVTNPDVIARDRILYLIANIAVGYGESSLLFEFDIKQDRFDADAWDARVTDQERTFADRVGLSPRVRINCYDAVLARTNLLANLLNDADSRLRIAATYASSWFPERSEQLISAICVRLHEPLSKYDISNALLAIGMLSRYDPSARKKSIVQGYLSHESSVVRTCAAIAFHDVPMSSLAVTTLLESMPSRDCYDVRHEDIPFNEGRLIGYASLLLAKFAKKDRGQIVPVLAEVMPHVGAVVNVDVTQALLILVFGERSQPADTVTRASLNSLQLTALSAIANCGAWWLGGSFCGLLQSYGLPWDEAEFRSFCRPA